ncbi:MAG TPA: S-layer homology domain-containing protein, partial [Thermoleophilia bacterium]|nr:S-layer homology domain-containing protein [Thermoleophilia bacterium]
MIKSRRATLIVFLTIALVAVAGVAYAQVAGFPDVSEDNVHADAIEWASDHGIVEGYVNGNFGPADNILRQQAASMFMRYDTFLRSSLNGGGTAGSCGDCHNSTDLISAKQAQWGISGHGTGDAFVRGTSASCAGCHSGGAFQDMIAAGMD